MYYAAIDIFFDTPLMITIFICHDSDDTAFEDDAADRELMPSYAAA